MAEKNTIVNQEKVSYSGVFQLNDFMTLVNSYFRQIGYDKRVLENTQQDLGNKKLVSIELRPWKKITDYVKLEISVWIDASVVNVKVQDKNFPKIVQKGDINVTISAAMITDYFGHWEQKPEYFFLRTVFNRFIYKVKFKEWDSMLKQQVAHFKAELSSFLNMNRFAEYHTMMDATK